VEETDPSRNEFGGAKTGGQVASRAILRKFWFQPWRRLSLAAPPRSTDPRWSRHSGIAFVRTAKRRRRLVDMREAQPIQAPNRQTYQDRNRQDPYPLASRKLLDHFPPASIRMHRNRLNAVAGRFLASVHPAIRNEAVRNEIPAGQ